MAAKKYDLVVIGSGPVAEGWATRFAAAGLDDHDRSTLAMLAFDYDRDGRQDLLVTGDYAPAQLWHNDGGRFRDVTAIRVLEREGSSTRFVMRSRRKANTRRSRTARPSLLRESRPRRSSTCGSAPAR